MDQMTELDVIALVALVIGLVKIFRPIGAAVGDRIRGRRAEVDDTALSAEVDQLRRRLAEVEERLDFAERLLAQSRETDQLPGGANR
jgi:hypothetical protein